ncbi:ATP-binding cassette domain-containing protein [Sphingoaurantiacus capsulatus]|uniref:ATP-binding cassette domain-containing protein n=1 Tax=Sphingoaurantiacus capsulatus TaxID=1771310 RepID=A0ABV7XFI6_9SPHN
MRFEIAVSKRIGELALDVAIRTDAPIAALFAPSGSGKTSLLNMVAGLLRPDAGRIVIASETLFDSAPGIDLPPDKRRVGYVFQDRRLFPHLSVRANLRYGRADADLAPVLDLLGIAHLLDRWPATLSGGEAQRVAIGRALLADPRVLLFDEPLSHLDRPRRDEILGLIRRLRDETGLPMLYVTHDAAEIDALGAERFDL